MCGLCSDDDNVREEAVKEVYRTAEMLERLAANYRDMAHLEIKPHTEASKRMGETAREVVRQLVAEWV